MRNSVRTLIGTTTVATLVGIFGLAGVAAAGTSMPGGSTPADPGCVSAITFHTPGGEIPAGATSVSATITGSIGGDPSGVLVSLVLDGVVGPAQPLSSTGTFSFGPQDIKVPIDLSITYTYGNGSSYTNVCTDPSGENVVRIRAAGASATAALAFTGSSDTTRNVLFGVAALVLGTVLVFGARRRKHIDA